MKKYLYYLGIMSLLITFQDHKLSAMEINKNIPAQVPYNINDISAKFRETLIGLFGETIGNNLFSNKQSSKKLTIHIIELSNLVNNYVENFNTDDIHHDIRFITDYQDAFQRLVTAAEDLTGNVAKKVFKDVHQGAIPALIKRLNKDLSLVLIRRFPHITGASSSGDLFLKLKALAQAMKNKQINEQHLDNLNAICDTLNTGSCDTGSISDYLMSAPVFDLIRDALENFNGLSK